MRTWYFSPATARYCMLQIPLTLQRSPPMNSLAALAGRILLVLIFLMSGIDNSVHKAATPGYMTKVGLPFPEVLLIASVIIEIVAALAIIAGWNTRWAAAALVVWM